MDSLLQAVVQATLISKFVLGVLLFMSVASWACMAVTWLTLRAARHHTRQGLRAFDDAGALESALSLVERERRSPLYGITRRAVREFNRISRANGNMRRALRFGITEELARLKPSLAFLATAANTAPFIGLFGTVWGIMHSFHAIASLKSVSLATVAPGIAEALIATAMGLFVAIPAVCGYNFFRARLTDIESVCVNYAGQLLNRMRHEMDAHREGISFAGER